jgi:hypothetical protein
MYSLTCHTSFTNFITWCCIEYTSPWTGFELKTLGKTIPLIGPLFHCWRGGLLRAYFFNIVALNTINQTLKSDLSWDWPYKKETASVHSNWSIELKQQITGFNKPLISHKKRKKYLVTRKVVWLITTGHQD